MSSTSDKKTFHKPQSINTTSKRVGFQPSPGFKTPFLSLSNLFGTAKANSVSVPSSWKSLFKRWNALPPKVRFWVGGSSFVVVFCADKFLTYSEKEERLRLEAEKLVNQEKQT